MKYLVKCTHSTDHVWYKLPEGNLSRNEDACYMMLFYNNFSSDVHTWINKKYVPYTQQSVERWVNDLKEMGFAFEMEVRENEYYFIIPVKRGDSYMRRLELTSLLTLIRYIWHTGHLSNIISYYFEIMDEIPDADKLEVIQMAHAYIKIPYFPTGHALRENTLRKAVSPEEFWKNVDSSPIITTRCEKSNLINTAWKGGELCDLRDTYLETYKSITNKILV